jgi:hypothetical protein
MLQSPKSESAASSGNIAHRTRGAHQRKLSNEGMESLASEHDLAQLDRANNSSSSVSSSTAHSSSSHAVELDDDRDMRIVVDAATQAAIAAFQQLRGNGSKSKDAHTKSAPSTNTPRPAISSSYVGGGKSSGVPIGGGNTVIPASTHRLLSAISATTGTPIFSSSGAHGAPAIAPGGPGSDVDENDDNGDAGDDDVDRGIAPSVATTGVNDLQWNHIYVRAHNRLAPTAIHTAVTHYRSMMGRCAAAGNRCSDIRNRFEVECLSAIADAAAAGRNDVVMELAVRRILGVEAADQGSGRDWHLATVLDLTKPGALVSDDMMRQLRRDVVSYKAAHAKPKSDDGKSSTAAGTGGPWRLKKAKRKGKGNKNGGGATGGAAAKE